MIRAVLASIVILAAPAAAHAQQCQNPMGTEAQRGAMRTLSWMDGEWRGTVTAMTPGGSRVMPHTERIGPMVGGSLKVIDGRSYNPDGSPAFNAFAVLSWDEEAGRYVMRSYADGHAADLPLEGDAEGFRWTVPTPGGELRYVTKLQDGEWVETGDFVMEGRAPMRVVELRLRRIGDTDWPAGGPVTPAD